MNRRAKLPRIGRKKEGGGEEGAGTELKAIAMPLVPMDSKDRRSGVIIKLPSDCCSGPWDKFRWFHSPVNF